ncbi:HNH endonuclease [Streptomyces sp. 6N106]|uniref:HNH endonuclease n=1 Tax=Streptomyces sp. 6N106 TaxID=3457418 RepID=UPI003FD5994C
MKTRGRGLRSRPLPPPLRTRSAPRPAAYDRRTVLARWRGCCYCDGPAEVLDHVTPFPLGGRDVESNLVAACHRCNGLKSSLSLADWARTE